MAHKATVAILGGGVGGLSAAHELAERGFEVTVYERHGWFGGKARSMRVPDTGTEGRRALPGEHGFRFFPGFYRHVTDTMKRIPYGDAGGCCYDNLEVATRILLARDGREEIVWAARFPKTIDDFKVVFHELFTNLGIPTPEVEFFISRLLGLATSCDERYLEEFELTPFWDFIEADRMSRNYQRYLGQGFTKSLVAMKAEKGSTRTVGRILLQLFYGILVPGRVFDRLLAGPTNDVWIFPWLKHLKELGVKLETHTKVLSLNVQGQEIRSVTVRKVEDQAQTEEVRADYYVCAVPVEVMQQLVTKDVKRAAPSLANLNFLNAEWMNGIQFYFKTDEPLAYGHTIFLDSAWSLTAVSQRQFWKNYDFSAIGNGEVNGILSVDISDWETPGNFNQKTAMDCSREEIKDEVWKQMAVALNVGGRKQIEERNLEDWFLDPDIQSDPDIPITKPHKETNLEPLMINFAGSLAYRPEAQTEIRNLFLASDYVKTYTDLATMEAANEAARRSVNAILADSGSSADPCGLWEFDVPLVLRVAQKADKLRFGLGLPNRILGQRYPRSGSKSKVGAG